MATISGLIQITDFNDLRIDIFVRLPEVQLLRYREPELGLFLAESPKVIERALEDVVNPTNKSHNLWLNGCSKSYLFRVFPCKIHNFMYNEN